MIASSHHASDSFRVLWFAYTGKFHEVNTGRLLTKPKEFTMTPMQVLIPL
jgi:hypothetical protein